jgi:hypothetical protein
MRWSATRICAVAAAAMLLPAPVPRGFAAEGEDDLKSAIVLSFLRYTTWPDRARSDEPITVGVVGRSTFARSLGEVLKGKSVNGRPLRMLELRAGVDLRCCHLVYLATENRLEIQQLLQNAGAAHTLTMGEAEKFLDYGGMINLLLVDGRMGFEVNFDALEHSGVDISSKLLRLGQIRRKRGA